MQVVLDEIRKYFGPIKANDGISLTLEGGRIYGLLGENGAGKSTLMKVLSGYYQPDDGRIEVGGEWVHFDSPADALEHGIGMIYQDPLDVPALRVVENYLLGRDTKVQLNFDFGKKELQATASEMGFEVDPEAHIDTLSLGERQQLELLRLLALGVQVLILDEPTTGISAEQKETLFASIRKLASEEGKTVILVSHKLADVQELCDHVIVLRRGKLVGEVDVPCPTEGLVRMMFVEIPPRKARESFVRSETSLALRQMTIESERLTLERIDLEVRVGEVFGLAGLEGSGQRLLLQACAGLLRPSQGQISLHGQDVTRYSYDRMRAAGVSYVPAGRLEEGLVAGLSIAEHVALTAARKTTFVDWKSFTAEAQARIERYQIMGRPQSNVETLSGGNQQRTLFALLNRPLQLLLLEHPTRGLDVRSAEWIWQLLFEYVEEGAAILFITTDLDELVERSDRIAAFSAGVMSRAVAASETTTEELGRMIGGEG